MQADVVMKMLMSKLQSQSPQNYKVVNELMRSNGNPSGLLEQVFGNMNPQQKQSILSQAKYFGAPNELLSKLQNDNN